MLPPMARERVSGPGCEAAEHTENLLDALLQTLYDVGEKDDETEQKRIRKKRDNRKRDGVAVAVAAERTLPGSLTRGQKKSTSSFFRELREELCAPVVTSHSPPSGAEVSTTTGSPSPLQNNREQVEVVQFHSRNKKRKLKPDQDECAKARLEVHRFGITGYGKGRERVLERERAIMLGAKPPKNSYMNYKVLQEQIKEKKAAKEEEKRAVGVIYWSLFFILVSRTERWMHPATVTCWRLLPTKKSAQSCMANSLHFTSAAFCNTRPRMQIFSRKRRGEDKKIGNPKRRSQLPVFCQVDRLDRSENSKMGP
ncbi:uncharacterized protein C1orf131 homolog isoform X2 [Fukomys damarensis]|uniref:uncharacterized protein C1orf131 homolog isoform X2 n=1 Tax=Fukomys damarensis TaxID=885580 RepID=UPI00053F3F96|nr:uncharacterized protein C1orf131 homolog isoform X2 [Fukomys damarensis]